MACSQVMTDSDLARFRTKLCQRHLAGCCEFQKKCQYSHDASTQRRCPFLLINKEPLKTLRYLPVFCPDLTFPKYDGKCSAHVKCEHKSCFRGTGCPFAHSAEEVLFHPLMYKQRVCPTLSSQDSSNRGCLNIRNKQCPEYYCSFIHSPREKRRWSFESYFLASSFVKKFPIRLPEPFSLIPIFSTSQGNEEAKINEPSLEPDVPLTNDMCRLKNIHSNSLSSVASVFIDCPKDLLFNFAVDEKHYGINTLQLFPGDLVEVVMYHPDRFLSTIEPIGNCEVALRKDILHIKALYCYARCVSGTCKNEEGWLCTSILLRVPIVDILRYPSVEVPSCYDEAVVNRNSAGCNQLDSAESPLLLGRTLESKQELREKTDNKSIPKVNEASTCYLDDSLQRMCLDNEERIQAMSETIFEDGNVSRDEFELLLRLVTNLLDGQKKGLKESESIPLRHCSSLWLASLKEIEKDIRRVLTMELENEGVSKISHLLTFDHNVRTQIGEAMKQLKEIRKILSKTLSLTNELEMVIKTRVVSTEGTWSVSKWTETILLEDEMTKINSLSEPFDFWSRYNRHMSLSQSTACSTEGYLS